LIRKTVIRESGDDVQRFKGAIVKRKRRTAGKSPFIPH